MKKFSKGFSTGKYISQGAHASIGAILSLATVDGDNLKIPLTDPFVREWLTGRFKKITVYVETDAELIDIYNSAKEKGLICSLIKDAGLTIFNGVPTLTAVGIGPGDPAIIDLITGKLPLLR